MKNNVASRQSSPQHLRMGGSYHYGKLKKDEMNFVYAAFFADRDDIYIKVGRSGTPYKRVQQIAESCPFVLSQAVFTSAGSVEAALKIERSLGHLLTGYRTRGEWFRFGLADGQVFSATVKTTFAKVTGRRLTWTVIDHAEILARMDAYSREWVRPRRAEQLAEAA